jgi:hypothetical protein
MLAREDPQVIVHRLGDHARSAPLGEDRMLIVERHDGDEHGRDGEGRNQGASPAGPPGRSGDRRHRPLGRQTPLQGQRRRILRQPLLEHLGERLLARLLAGAGRAALEVSLNLRMHVGLESAALVIEETRLHILAVHCPPYLA